jgi:hypothetical protein
MLNKQRVRLMEDKATPEDTRHFKIGRIGEKWKGLASRFRIFIFAALFMVVGGLTILYSSAATSTITLTPIEDSYVDKSNPNTNFNCPAGARCSRIIKAKKDTYTSYLKFKVDKIPEGATVKNVTLSMVVLDKSVSSGIVSKVANDNNTWNESGITWTNQPGVGQVLADGSKTPANNNATVTFNLPAGAITGNGTYSFAVTSNELSDTAGYRPRETDTTTDLSRTQRPTLTIAVDSSSADTTAPVINLTTPTNNATLTGTVNVSAAASDNVGVAGVQFLLDGANLGAEVTSAPYSVNWNTTTVPNGSHIVTAIARDAAGNKTAAAAFTVDVNNAATSPPPATSTGSTCPNLTLSQCVPYDALSAWNTPIGSSPSVLPSNDIFISEIAKTGVLTSDITQYTQPVYLFDASTPTYTVTTFDNGADGGSGPGYFNLYDGGDKSRVGAGTPWKVNMPIPQKLLDDIKSGKLGLTSPSGNDAQVILWDPVRGIEYGLWQVMISDTANPSAGNLTATNGYRYHTTAGYFGRMAGAKDGNPPNGGGRGAGTPYLAGLVRPWEIAQGHIDHALSFAYHAPSGGFVYPATKSDGANFGGTLNVDAPEGTRLQLNPALTDDQLGAMNYNGTPCSSKDAAGQWKLTPCLIIAHALQKYGMYIIDNSGSPKVYLEQDITAGWGSLVGRNTLSSLPWSQFRAVQGPTGP